MPLLQTLGRLTLERPDGTDAGGRRMILALLAWLSRQRHRAAARERLVTAFWERQEATAGRHSLRQALSEVRSLLPGALLDTGPERVALTAEAVELDADRFEARVSRGEWREALELYGGDFLAGLDDLGGEEWRTWLEGERATLRRQAEAACSAAIQEASAEADWALAVALAERWAALAPGDDRPIVALVRALLAAGRPAEASGRHAGHLERLRMEGREPGPELLRLGATLRQPAIQGRARGLLSPDFVGRHQPFAQLTTAWGTVTAGAVGQVLVVEAEDGLGKTRLLEEFARWVRARPRPGLVIEAKASEGDGGHPWRVLSGILDRLSSAPGLAATSGSDLAALARLSPQLRQRFPHQAEVPGEDVGGALTRMMAEVGQEQPVLLLLDDVDRADPDSARALAGLALHAPARLLVVIAGRPGRLGDGAFGAVLRDAGATGDTLRLRTLSQAEAVQFVASMGPMDPAAARAIGEAAVEDLGGSPATIHLLVTDLVDQGVLRPGPTGRLELPRPLDRPLALPELLRDRWARLARDLPAPSRALLHLVAAAPGGAGVDDLARSSGLGPEPFQDAIGDLLSRRLIRRAPGAAVTFECASEVLRRAVLETLPPQRQAELRDALSGVDRAPRRRTPGAVVAGALVLAVLAILVWVIRAPRLPAGELALLVTDVQTNASEDDALARPLFLAAMTELQEGTSVRPVPRSLVRDAVIRMGRPGADSLVGEALALEVAAREGIELVAVLEVHRQASGRELRYRLLEAATGDLIDAGSVPAEDDEAVLPAANRLLRHLSAALGESGETIGDAAGYPRLSTHSFAALKHYTEGSRAWTARDYGRATKEWELAVALDTSFALAWTALAGEAFRGQHQPRGREYLSRAKAHAARLSPREQLLLNAAVARWTGTSAQARDAARALATGYPDRDSWYTLGTTLMRQQRCEEAIPALRRSVALDSAMTNAYVNLATCHQFLQQYDSAVTAYHLAGATDSTVLRIGNVGVEYGMALRMLGDDDAAGRHYEAMSGWGLEWNRGFATRQMAWMAMARGQYRSAASLAGRAAQMQQAASQPLGVFRDRMLRARALLRAGSPQAATEIREAWRTRPDSLLGIELLWPFVELAREAGLRGEAEAMRRRALALARPGVVTHEPLVAALQATSALDRGDPAADALARIEEAWPRPAGERWGYLDLVRAEALERAGQRDSALAQWKRIAESRWVGWEIEDHWSHADLAVARLMAELGRTAEAVTSLNRLLARWQDGDPDAPNLVATRQLQRRVLAEVRDGARLDDGGRR